MNEITDAMREMNKWCNEIIKEAEGKDIGSEHNENLPKVSNLSL